MIKNGKDKEIEKKLNVILMKGVEVSEMGDTDIRTSCVSLTK